LFERAGFEILDAGVCVGPTVALTDLAFEYLRELLPGRALRRVVSWGVRLVLFPLRLVDRIANSHPNAHTVGSTTFVHGRRSLPLSQVNSRGHR
jgi:hypothetical protein